MKQQQRDTPEPASEEREGAARLPLCLPLLNWDRIVCIASNGPDSLRLSLHQRPTTACLSKGELWTGTGVEFAEVGEFECFDKGRSVWGLLYYTYGANTLRDHTPDDHTTIPRGARSGKPRHLTPYALCESFWSISLPEVQRSTEVPLAPARVVTESASNHWHLRQSTIVHSQEKH